jgi:hypothetical protein
LRAVEDRDARNRELQIQVAAARAGVPINSALVSRSLKDCAAEQRWASAPQIEDGVLYLLSYEAIEASTALDGIARSSVCERLPWGVACSSKWGEATKGAAPFSSIH